MYWSPRKKRGNLDGPGIQSWLLMLIWIRRRFIRRIRVRKFKVERGTNCP